MVEEMNKMEKALGQRLQGRGEDEGRIRQNEELK